jgi:hypothetical protein
MVNLELEPDQDKKLIQLVFCVKGAEVTFEQNSALYKFFNEILDNALNNIYIELTNDIEVGEKLTVEAVENGYIACIAAWGSNNREGMVTAILDNCFKYITYDIDWD